MANRLINIAPLIKEEKVPRSNESLEVYKDISMTSLSETNGLHENTPVICRNINAEAVKLSLHNCFSWIVNQRVLLPEFGSRLMEYLYEGITDYNSEKIMAEIKHTVVKWEPRVLIERVENITSTNNVENNTICLNIVYTIPSLSKDQYSYSFIYKR